jgi:hypothetical protein
LAFSWRPFFGDSRCRTRILVSLDNLEGRNGHQGRKLMQAALIYGAGDVRVENVSDPTLHEPMSAEMNTYPTSNNP